MPSSKEKRAQRHQSQSKQNIDRFSGRGKTTQNIPGVGYREVQLIGNKKYYTSLSDDPNQSLGGSTADTSITVTGGSSANHGALSGLLLDSHTQYVLADGTRAFGGNWTNAGITVADLGIITTVDINGGTIDGVTIATSDVTVGTGKTLDVSGGTLTLSNDQISGDKINGGTIGSVTIGQLSGALDANSQAITNINIDSGNIDGVTIATSDITVGTGKTLDVSAGTLTLADNQISGDKVEGGTIASITISQLSGAMDANSQVITNVNIDSGAIDGTPIGATSHTTIKGTTIDATTDFTIGTTVITDDQIEMSPTNGTFTISSTNSGLSTIATIDTTGSNGAHLLLDTQGDLIASPNTQLIKFHDGSNYVFEFDTANVKFKMADDADTGDYFEISTAQHGATTITTIDDDATAADLTFDIDGNINFKQTSGTTRYTFNIDSTPQLDVTGDFTIDGSGVINIDGDTGVVLKESGTEVIKIDTEKKILFNSYSQTSIYNLYGLNNQATKYHLTSGQADFQENFSVISMFEEDTTYIAYPT